LRRFKYNKSDKNDYILNDYILKNNKNFTDISSIFNKNYINTHSSLTTDEFTKLFMKLNTEEQYLLFCNICISSNCHLVINNYTILNKMLSTIKEFANLFRYLLSYSWIVFYYNECNNKNKMKSSDTYIFTIDIASLLPIYPFNHAKPKLNPYMPILVSDSELNPAENICGIPDYNDSNENSILNNKGICTLNEFKDRLNIFCTGRVNKNIFNVIDFKEYDACITGSIITACLQKSHPLMCRFFSHMDDDYNSPTFNDALKNFFDEYYAESDIDIMFKEKNIQKFISKVYKFYEVLKSTLNENTELILNKTAILYISKEFIEDNIIIPFTINDDKISYIMNNKSNKNIKDLFVPYYKVLCEETYKNIIKNMNNLEIIELKKNYSDLFHFDIDFNIYIKEEVINDVELIFSYKYRIKNNILLHDLELFQIDGDDFFDTISKFHLPCVRGYYDGYNVYMTPSCISSHMTYMNLDYKYISSNKHPLEIINKYRLRGFGTWLNSIEKQLMVDYCKEIPYWKNLYDINDITDSKVFEIFIFGPLHMNVKFYYPRLYNIDYYYSKNIILDNPVRYLDISLCAPIYLMKQITMNKIIKDKFLSNKLYDINFDNYIAIDIKGNINPVQKWLITTAWNLRFQ
jgi:hypothetical protein